MQAVTRHTSCTWGSLSGAIARSRPKWRTANSSRRAFARTRCWTMQVAEASSAAAQLPTRTHHTGLQHHPAPRGPGHQVVCHGAPTVSICATQVEVRLARMSVCMLGCLHTCVCVWLTAGSNLVACEPLILSLHRIGHGWSLRVGPTHTRTHTQVSSRRSGVRKSVVPPSGIDAALATSRSPQHDARVA